MKRPGQIFLSKTKFLEGLTCPKLLWYDINKKELLPPPSPDLQEMFAEGHRVGELAQKLWPDGIVLARDVDPVRMTAKSLSELAKRKPVFEAGLTYKQTYALPDVLEPVGDDEWDLIEVKSSTGVKEDHLYDLAFQKYVYEGRGLKIRKIFLLHLDRDYVRQGELELDKLFAKEDVTTKIDKLGIDIAKNVEEMLAMIAGPEPEIKAGEQCRNDCPLEDLCWNFLPADHVFLLRGGPAVSFELMAQGILSLKDIPKTFALSAKHSIQVMSHVSGAPHADVKAIGEFLKQLKYPLYFLDFETMAPAIPIFDQTRPYEDIPFQYSLHIIETEGGRPRHLSYLAPGDVDPRPEVLRQLREYLGSQGSIIAYFADYEKKVLAQAVRAWPEYAAWFDKVKERFVDLLVPFKNLSYYHPAQQGSASMKSVLPALTGKSYKDLAITDGGAARREYMRVTFGQDINTRDRARVRGDLEKYCALDTQGMIDILGHLRDRAAGQETQLPLAFS